MKLKKRVIAILAVFALFISLFSGAQINSFAAQGAPTLTAKNSSEQVSIALCASEDLSGFSGLQVEALEYDKDAFTQSNVTSADGLTVTVGDKIAVTSESGVDIAAGEPIITVIFDKNSETYKDTSKYIFSIKLSEAYDDDLDPDKYTWGKSTFTCEFLENEEASDEGYITYNGEKLYDSVIASCLDENGDALLKDVLEAAGIEATGNCYYTFAAEDGYSATLRADWLDDMVLFDNDNDPDNGAYAWRNSLTQSKVEEAGIQGGWYKITGLEAITTGDHNHVDGICNNVISISKKETEVCGDAEGYITYNGEKLYDSVIASCLDENGDALLKDVLEAAGIEATGNCYYTFAAEDGYSATLRADWLDDMVLFDNDNDPDNGAYAWRNSLTQSKVEEAGIQGGWYKITGLEAITTGDHNHVDGICNNVISISKKETEVCGDVEETPVLTGWKKIDGKWYYYDASGNMVTNSWQKDSKGWCYLGSNGQMVTNSWQKDSKGWCYLGSNGYMVTNSWQKDSKGWCYLGSNGYMVTNSWQKDSKGWCYLGSNGYMVTNSWVKDSKGWCYLGSNGYLVTNGWAKDSKGWCWMDSNGHITTSKWIQDGNDWYYLKANGYMAANEWAQDSTNWYWMGANGKITSTQKK